MTDIELARRLERLERDNRQLKRGGLALLAMLVTLTTIYATRPVPDVIKAHEFEAVDAAGVRRAILDASMAGSPSIVLYDKHGGAQLQVSAFDSVGPEVMLGFHPAPRPVQSGAVIPDVVIRASPLGEPSIELQDAQGFRMDLGSTSAIASRTGVTEQTSADSIIMWGNSKNHHAIWRAP